MNIKLNQDKNILMLSAKNKNYVEKNLKLKKLEYPIYNLIPLLKIIMKYKIKVQNKINSSKFRIHTWIK
jgi:hypothetical protein